MNRAYFRFYAELNDFLPSGKKMVTFAQSFEGRASVKDMIEALGVPHTEVDLILANGGSVDFSYIVQDADRISVYPVFESIDIAPLLRVRSRPLRMTRFVLDIHLGKLATYLRMLGFDTLYRNDYPDEELARLSHNQKRILLSRDRGLLKRGLVTHGYCVRETAPFSQLVEIVRRFDLSGSAEPFRRCLRCNGLLRCVSKEEIVDRLLPATIQYNNDFRRCQGCGRVYWKGSHYQRMQQVVDQALRNACLLQDSLSP
jgi:uncharacterized protein with PIN domain